jgi:DNA-binding beta-propeller fold protein YncE
MTMRLLVGAPAARLAVLVAIAALAVSACSAGKAPSAATTPPATIRPHSAVQATPQPPSGGPDDILIARTANAGYQVLFGGSGESLFKLPDGAASAAWQTIATAEVAGDFTTVRLLAGEGGEPRGNATLRGRWQLPSVGLAGAATGLSADGRVVVLEEADADLTTARTTRFAVVTPSRGKPRVITLDGAFTFDALSPNGAWLYLIQHSANGAPTYQVRRAAVSTGKLDDTVIVDKRNPDEVMQGYAVTQRAGPDGWVYTLYQGAEGAFVHALDTAHGGAFCIDLPDTETEDKAEVARWGLALEPRGSSLYAANGETGKLFEIDLEEFAVARQGSIPRQVGAIELAKFENGAWAAAGSVAVDPKGEILYVAGDDGVAALRTSDLSLVSRLDAGHAYRSVVVAASGTVYGIDVRGALMRLGSPSNPFIQPIATSGYASIEGVLTLR